MKMMKKLAALIAAMTLLTNTAAACTCQPDRDARLAVCRMATVEALNITADEATVLETIVLDAKASGETRTLLLTIMLRDADAVKLAAGEDGYNALLAYIAHCCCEADKPAATPKPTTTQKPAAHTHAPGPFVSLNNSQHARRCACGYQYEAANHRPGELLGVEANGLGRYKCLDCGAILYWHMGGAHDTTQDTECCECHLGSCCEECACGCTQG